MHCHTLLMIFVPFLKWKNLISIWFVIPSSAANQDMMQNVVNGFRRSRLIMTTSVSSVQKYTLSTLMVSNSFNLSRTCVTDVESDIRKGLQCLHDNGMVHGNITPSSVIIDGVRYYFSSHERCSVCWSREFNLSRVFSIKVYMVRLMH